MIRINKYLKTFPLFIAILCIAFNASSQQTDLKDYCISGYYAGAASSNFKTPFILNFGANNTFQKLDVSGKLYEGKYTMNKGLLILEFVGGEERYQVSGETVTDSRNRTYAKLEKKIFGNRLKGNRYTGILYKQNSKVAERVSYQFIGDKFSISGEKGPIASFSEYTLVGNMAGYKWNGPGGVKSTISHRVFVLYGNQLVVINNYKNQSEGATYGILDLVK